jgi:hypothetical protein
VLVEKRFPVGVVGDRGEVAVGGDRLAVDRADVLLLAEPATPPARPPRLRRDALSPIELRFGRVGVRARRGACAASKSWRCPARPRARGTRSGPAERGRNTFPGGDRFVVPTGGDREASEAGPSPARGAAGPEPTRTRRPPRPRLPLLGGPSQDGGGAPALRPEIASAAAARARDRLSPRIAS